MCSAQHYFSLLSWSKGKNKICTFSCQLFHLHWESVYVLLDQGRDTTPIQSWTELCSQKSTVLTAQNWCIAVRWFWRFPLKFSQSPATATLWWSSKCKCASGKQSSGPSVWRRARCPVIHSSWNAATRPEKYRRSRSNYLFQLGIGAFCIFHNIWK